MAQSQQSRRLSIANLLEQPQQQRQAGPQLPPIHSILPSQSGRDHSKPSFLLPSMQVSPWRTESSPSSAAAVRSIPVTQLLSTNPPSPPAPHIGITAQRTTARRTSAHTYPRVPVQYGVQPSPYQIAPPCHSGPARIPFEQQQLTPTYPVEQCIQTKYQPRPPSSFHSEHTTHQVSPAVSVYSSPSLPHSGVSPRSSLGTQSHSDVAPKPRPSALPSLNFDLSIRQQPVAARACGFGERDRRVVDPPPILELKITDHASGYPAQDPAGMLALNCSLLSADGCDDETELPPTHPDTRSTQRLMGTLVASPYHAKDEHGTAGTFFVFPDLSCRSPGKYRLRFRLLRVEPLHMARGGRSVATIVTDVFSAYAAKDFPGMRASSALLKALRRQGLNVGVKKGSEARKDKGRTTRKKECVVSSSSEAEERSDDDDDAALSNGAGLKTAGRKKAKRRRREENDT